MKRQRYRVADYVGSESNQTLRKTLIQKRLSDPTSDHKLAIETGCHRKSWQARGNRLSQSCQQDVETEQHFVIHCSLYVTK